MEAINRIFENKTKNIIVTALAALCTVSQIYEAAAYTASPDVSVFLKILQVLPYALVLIYMLTLKREYKIKGFLFPTAFLCSAAYTIYTVIYSVCNFSYSLSAVIYALKLLTFDIVMAAAFILCAIGSADSFKRLILFKIGTLVLAITALVLPVVSFISVGGFAYIAAVPDGYSAIAYDVLINCVLSVLYYFGLFALTTGTRPTEQR